MQSGVMSRSGNRGQFLACFTHPKTIRRAVKVALVVGPILGFINHFDVFFGGVLTPLRFLKICVTFLVPFSVSAYSSATTMMEGLNCESDPAGTK
jgi:hypothetical protein